MTVTPPILIAHTKIQTQRIISCTKLKGERRRVFRIISTLSLALLMQAASVPADPVPVRYSEGSIHGFLALRTLEGKVIAEGDLVQVTKGDLVRSQLTFHFRDGSIDDDSAVFSQKNDFRLISDHHIQRGPSFPTPMDLLVNASTGEVTARSREKGLDKVEKVHMDLPPDLANGIILDLLKNVSPTTKETKVSYLVAAPKPRIVKLAISPEGEEKFKVVGVPREAMRFNVKVELGGIVGLVAPMIGKQPADTEVWIAGGKAPAFVRSDGPAYLGGPLWSIQMSSPDWGQSQRSRR